MKLYCAVKWCRHLSAEPVGYRVSFRAKINASHSILMHVVTRGIPRNIDGMWRNGAKESVLHSTLSPSLSWRWCGSRSEIDQLTYGVEPDRTCGIGFVCHKQFVRERGNESFSSL